MIRNQIAAVIITLVYLLIVESIIGGLSTLWQWLADIYEYLPGAAASAVTQVDVSNSPLLAPWAKPLIVPLPVAAPVVPDTLPPKVSGEVNRDSDMDRQDYIVGRKNLSDLVEADGRSFADHLRQRAEEAQAKYDLINDRVKYPDISDADFGIITANGNPSKQDIAATETELENTDPNAPANPAAPTKEPAK